ncbi:tol-pal system YbgF family protein [Brevundimonas pondensis]|uniref:tol-pal system protein n=1 Tax=Brevundimonas pondensis TaxID=2774189 RepID=UPI001CECCBAB|nr:tol-pal system protein [Brevundimonas pondensis]
MLKLPFSKSAALTAIGLTLIGGAVVAQVAPMEPVQWDKRRLDQLDRNVRRLERALTQRNAAGQPVLVEPDPEVVAMQGQVSILERRLADVEQTFQRMNADSERLTFQLDEATRDNAALSRRLRDLEGRVERAEKAAEEEAELNGPIVANSPTGDAAQDLTAALRLLGTDGARGQRALETVIVTWPNTPQSREANSRLGDLHVAARDNAAAVPAYAAALNGWPRTPWAPETTLKLAEALRATDRNNTQACGA